MAVKENKKRVMITLPKRQIEWLYEFCKDHDISISHYISYMLSRKAEEMIEILRIDKNKYTEEEFEEILRIIKQPWINKD